MSTRTVSHRAAQIRANAVRTIVFVVVAAMLGTLIALTLGRFRVEDSTTYRAMFTDVSGLGAGAEVRAAGVVVGRVDETSLDEDNRVEVSFTAADAVPLTTTTQARVRYANLTGDRFLELTTPQGAAGEPLAEGATIPEQRTSPALDLDMLFNGFRPLTQALEPSEVNRLTASLIAVSQGQGSALESLLHDVGSLTSHVGERDALIGRVIARLGRVLGTVDRHRGDVRALVDGLADLTHGLARDRKAIGSSLPVLADLARNGEGYLRSTRPSLRSALREARHVARVFNSNAAYADRYLRLMPAAIRAIGRAGAYGSFFNFYLCGVRFKVTGAGGEPTFTPFQLSKEDRCQF